ncbi:hypothetical protein D9M70_518750 [compost metagenome]
MEMQNPTPAAVRVRSVDLQGRDAPQFEVLDAQVGRRREVVKQEALVGRAHAIVTAGDVLGGEQVLPQGEGTLRVTAHQ